MTSVPVSVAVIGAGPYGLSTAAHLRALGVSVRVFGSPMVSWAEQMPAGMLLKSTPLASNISAAVPGHTLQDFGRELGEQPLVTDWDIIPVDTFIGYGRWFQERLVPDLEQVRVVSVDRRGALFDLKLDSGEQFQARAVVVATGLHGFAHVPEVLRGVVPDGPSAAGSVSHSSQHPDLGRLGEREVIVVGAGQSALESAALLAEAGARVRLLARGRRRGTVGFGVAPDRQPRLRPESPFGRAWSLYAFSYHAQAFRHLPAPTRLYLVRRVLGPLGAWWLRERFEGKVRVSTGHEIRGARTDSATGRVVLSTAAPGGRAGEFAADHVLAATGYRVDLEALGFLSPELRARLARVGRTGSPRLGADFGSSVPGLFFTGLPAAATFGPVLRFVCGTEWASPRLAKAVAAGVA
ncbi:FAD-dependent oxidoreductase [Streptomyces sp. NBC_01262]|uniref:FAD-dependent oxidoreductase n=1 Tax=Streptomyces sp. NBC_01262 TaxID=2903803 RepID=UPI002E32E6E3|nr:FAD-dependent oxidoreductase [Streptomyces sp. NBC_01262]